MKNFWFKLKKPIICAAPMAGITDSAMRQICREEGADVVYTEMTSIDALYYSSEKTMSMLKMQRGEKPVVAQLFGKRPELSAKAVRCIERAGFSGIDINFGCPARKVIAHGGGISLLKDLNLCHELVQAVCESTKLPISVKTRVSINKGDGKVTVLDFLEKIKSLPVSALMLHGRTYEQGFAGEVNYEMMKIAKDNFKGVFIGNGGVDSPEKAKKMLELAGADGVAVGRAMEGSPWIFSQIRSYFKRGIYQYPTIKQIKKIILRHAKYSFKEKGDHGIIELRKHLCWYFRGFPQAAKFRNMLVKVITIEDVKNILDEI